MNKYILIIFVFGLFMWNANYAQKRKAVVGNGKEKSISYDLQSFDVLEVLWLGGKIEVEYGAAKSDISIVSDENLLDLLEVTNTKGTLRLEIKGNERNKLWLEDTKTVIKIRTTSQPQSITFKANANARLKGIDVAKLQVIKSENGNLALEGKATQLNLEKDGNGNVNAQNLLVETAAITSMGNGNVGVNAKKIDRKWMSGNGSLWNEADKKSEKAW